MINKNTLAGSADALLDALFGVSDRGSQTQRPETRREQIKPIFQLIARDLNSDSEGWCWLAVVRFTGGPLAMAEDGRTVTDEQIQEIYNFLATYGIHVASSGNGCAGHRYSNEPFLQWFTEHVVISQSGGLDV